MSEVNVRLYEGLFLLSAQASGDLAGSMQHVKDILDRAEAEIISLRKWDDRKLAYAIKGQKRGTYILAYFNARGTQIANIERDCNLSELIARVLMVKPEHMAEAELELEKKEAEERGIEAALRDQSASEEAPAEETADSAPAEAAAPAPAPEAEVVASAEAAPAEDGGEEAEKKTETPTASE